ncbi:MAG: type II toxin-antitoxin system HicB family antitoxin [Deltaproteobacteria bacterium]|nr:type II toxin-antitoxin system HicB family antitoxin [Deltaproteobacteria bacterium]
MFEPAEEGGYVVSVPALPGCVTQGDTFEEARKMAKDAIKGYIAVLREEGQSIPEEKEEVITAPLYIPILSRG